MKFGAQQRNSVPIEFTDEKFYLTLLAFLLIFTLGIVTRFALELHENFLTIACDTAEFQNSIVNTLHGHWFRDTVADGPNLLGMHSLFVFLVIAPLYTVFPSPNTLFILQIVCVYSIVIPIYLVGLELLKHPVAALVVAALTLACPMLLHMAVSPFHPETWIATAIFWTYYFYRRRWPIGFWISLVIALTSGEEASFICLSLGTALFLVEDGVPWRKRYGLFLFVAGLVWIVISVGVISPLMRVPVQQNLFGYHYSQWNVTSAPGLALAAVENPEKTFSIFFDSRRWIHLLLYVGPTLALVVFSRTSLILMAPLPVFFLMSDQEFYLDFHAYYFSFALVAGYLGLLLLLRRWETAGRLGVGTLACVYLLGMVLLCNAVDEYTDLARARDDGFSQLLLQVFASIPPEAGVYGPHRYSAYLSARENMVMGDLHDSTLDFDAMVENKFATTGVHPGQIDYIVCDYLTDQCGWRSGNLVQEDTKLRESFIETLVKSGDWETFWSVNNVVILKRVGAK